MKNMINVVQSKMAKINVWFGREKASRKNSRDLSPPCVILEDDYDLRDQENSERVYGLRRLHSLRDKGSIHHGSMSTYL